MNGKMNKNTIFLVLITAISFIAAFFTSVQTAIVIFLVLLIIYLLVTKKYLFKVFKGSTAYKQEEFEKALECYRDASMSPWCNGSTITNYLICELKYGKTSIAKEYITENLPQKNISEKDKTNIDITKALVLCKSNEINESINILVSLAKSNKSTYLYETLTSVLLSARKFEEAGTYLNDAREYDEDSSVIKSNYAEYLYHTGKLQESKKLFDELIADNVRFMEPYYYVALMENKAENFNYALELLQTAEGFNTSLVGLLSKDMIKQAQNTVLTKSLNA